MNTHAQQHQGSRDWIYEQQPAQLATPWPTPPPPPEEGELPPEPQHQQYIYYQPSNGAGAHEHQMSDADAYQWHTQQQYAAFPSEQNEQQYAEPYQQAQYCSYDQQQQQYQAGQQDQQQQAGSSAAAAYDVKDFNQCDAWFGPWPGFVFKLVGCGAVQGHCCADCLSCSESFTTKHYSVLFCACAVSTCAVSSCVRPCDQNRQAQQ